MQPQGRHILANLALGLCMSLGLSACGGGGSSAPAPAPAPGNNIPPPPVSTVSFSGTISYDRVPHNTATNGLLYSATQVLPVRGALVELLNAAGVVQATGTTNAAGQYSFSLEPGTQVRLRVKAQLLRTGAPSWNFRVTDNTNGNSLYALESSLETVSADLIRDLHAPSGWTGTGYGNPRSAAPFAILDTVYEAVQFVLGAEPQLFMPAAELRWSVENKPVKGDRSLGEITSSSFLPHQGNIYLLGQENVDTDEYDRHVILHEFGHYLEHRFSRSDSPGGPHSVTDRLDLRLAFGEGWGNAFAAMAAGDPVYRDASGPSQSWGFEFSAERNSWPAMGWYSEASVLAILYDLYDEVNEGPDSLSLGFAALFDTLRDARFTQTPAATSIFSFIEVLREREPTALAGIDALLQWHGIHGSGHYGEGETNHGGIASTLPPFKLLTPGAGAVAVCSDPTWGSINKHGNIALLRLNITTPRYYAFAVNRQSGALSSDPDVMIWRLGEIIAIRESSIDNSEIFDEWLPAGDYLVEVAEWTNINDEEGDERQVCFSVTVN